MLDTGLVLTGVVLVAVLYGTARWVPAAGIERGAAADRLLIPAIAGLAAARVAAATLDDRASLGSLRALLVVRGGVDFWPGVAMFLALLVWTVRRDREPVLMTVAELVPFALWSYAAFEAACLLRDGCYGPTSTLGFVPEGLRTRMFPVGLVIAIVVALLGCSVRSLWSWAPRSRLVLAAGGLAVTRAVAAIWLPRLGDDATRQQMESAVVAVAMALTGAVLCTRAVLRRRALRRFT